MPSALMVLPVSNNASRRGYWASLADARQNYTSFAHTKKRRPRARLHREGRQRLSAHPGGVEPSDL